LGEDTGLLITNNNEMEAIGSGLVILVDRDIKDTNITQVQLGQPISINLVVHVMSMNDTYDIGTHKMQIHNS
jgi:cyanophycinase